MSKFALYQKWPARTVTRFDISDTSEPTLAISILPATKQGLDQAVKLATRSDAKLVKMEQDFYDDIELQHYVERRISRGKFVSLFQPAKELP